MTLDDVRPFLEENHRGVVTTFRRSGAAQMSILASGLYQESAVFVVSGNTAKLANLKRDPRCTVLTLRPDWSEYVVVEGDAEIHSWDNTEYEELRLLLRRAYTACGGGEHPDWLPGVGDGYQAGLARPGEYPFELARRVSDF